MAAVRARLRVLLVRHPCIRGRTSVVETVRRPHKEQTNSAAVFAEAAVLPLARCFLRHDGRYLAQSVVDG